MNLKEQKNKYRALHDWFTTPQGFAVQQAINEQIKIIKHKLRGSLLLQIGLCGENSWLKELNFRKQWILTPYSAENTALIATPQALPFDRHGLDCILMPFMFEAFGRQKMPLHEIDRVLRPMGHLIFLGINPFSLWGLLLGLGYLECFGGERGMLTSSLVLKQMLFNRGYKQVYLETFYYLPPLQSPLLMKKLQFLNQMGKMIAPSPAGFYCLVVQKYQFTSFNLLQQKKQRILIGEQMAGAAL